MLLNRPLIFLITITILFPRGECRADGTWETYSLNDKLTFIESIQALCVDHGGAVWCGTVWDGVMRFDGSAWASYTRDDGLADNWIRSIAIAPDGAVWIGGYHAYGPHWGQQFYAGGVSRFDGDAWTTYTEKDGLASDAVKCIAVGDDGTVWAGAEHYVFSNARYFRGLSRFDGETWTTFDETDGLVNNAVNALAVETGGAVWAGTREGVSRFDGSTWRNYTEIDGLVDNYVKTIVIDHEGTVWFGTPRGLSGFDGAAWTSYTVDNGLVNDSVKALAVDSENTLWCGTSEGLYRFSGGSWESIAFNDSVAAIKVDALAVGRDNDVWVGFHYSESNPDRYEVCLSRYFPEKQTAVEETPVRPPGAVITGSFPNPFNTETNIQFTVSDEQSITLVIYNLLGQRVRKLTSRVMRTGKHTVRWDGRDDYGRMATSGVYIVRLVSGSMTSNHRMLLIQ